MEKLTSTCPCCSNPMEIERLRCSSCDVAVEGKIPIPRLARLSAEDREFVELFVRSSGSLKAVAEKMGISYPTIRSRLNRVIEALEREEESERSVRNQILDEVEQGSISVDEAVRRLREM
jgi:hypothetical protein